MAATPSTDEQPARPGRPRRYQEAEEHKLLLDAGFEVIRRNGYAETTVADVLAEAKLSTRAFYRHFASKDELLRALFRRDTERFSAAVGERVASAQGPEGALEVWLDEILGFGLDRERARRAAVLGSEAAMRALPPEAVRTALDNLLAPLVEAIGAGAVSGIFTSDRPQADALMISALAWDTSGRIRESTTTEARDELREALLSFVLRGLGAGRA